MRRGKDRGKGGMMLALIILLGMVPPLASDLYMPGLPVLTREFATAPELATYTMTAFFLFLAVGSLVVGPLCDKVGRKPVRLICTGLAFAASVGCATAPSIWWLLALRCLQGLGGGGMLSVSTALVKDCYNGERMVKVLGIVQAASMVMPIVAPLLGAGILVLFGWRGTFGFMAVVFTLALVLGAATPETMPEKGTDGADAANAGAFSALMRNRAFILPLLSGGFFLAAFNAYLAMASYVYEDFFGMSAAQFSAVFSITAIASIVAPLLYTRFGSHMRVERVMGWIFAASGIAEVALCLVGATSPFAFMGCVVVLVFCLSLVRPMLTNYVLAPLEGNVGMASALLNFVFSAIGCLGMAGAALGIGSVVFGVQSTVAVCLAISLALWVVARRM